jgi:hydrogenase maturation protease
MKKIAVMGFGNPVRSDDGVGCRVVELLQKEYSGDADISIFDMGTSAFEVLFQLKGHDVLIIVDAVIHSNVPDGAIFRLPASAIQAAIVEDPMVFLHSLKWDQALSYAKKIMQAEFPEGNIYVYLIAVSDLRLEMGLSEPVALAALEVAGHIRNDIEQLRHGTHL